MIFFTRGVSYKPIHLMVMFIFFFFFTQKVMELFSLTNIPSNFRGDPDNFTSIRPFLGGCMIKTFRSRKKLTYNAPPPNIYIDR